ncbi:MAG TPA: DUF1552 domain-containing protein [Polyangiaceae bacterium]|nr:DUF1552 domain-containing protein [Polyangiaceae bacterium]
MPSTRRQILRALGLSAAMSPFLPFLNREAEAQAQGFPVRLLLVFTGNGSVPSKFWPSGGETDFTFAPGSITEALAPFKSKLIFPKKLNRVQTGPGGHESAMVPLWTAASRNDGGNFGGYSKLPSVDQIIAQAIPADTTFKSLEFGVMSDGAGANKNLLSVMSYAGNDQPIKPESNPYNMWDRLMLGTAEDPSIAQQELEKLRARRQSSLDLVRNELRALTSKIDRDDRIKLEQHVTALGEIEKRLGAPPGPPPAALNPEPPREGLDLAANDSFPEILKLQNSMAVAALAANRTRVASLMWGRSFSLVKHTWAGVQDEHHTLSHETTEDATNKKQGIETWFMQQMADLLTQLDSVPEGDGTLLDNTMLIYCNELAEGAAHNANPAITFVAGSAGKQLKTGRLLELGPDYDWAQLLCTACQVMGATSVTRVGDLGKEGHIPALLV